MPAQSPGGSNPNAVGGTPNRRRKGFRRTLATTVPPAVMPVGPAIYRPSRQPNFIRGVSRKSTRGTFRSKLSTVIVPQPSAAMLTFWYTGAASDGAAQSSQAASIGNFRSSTEAERVGILYESWITGLRIDMASRDNLDAVYGLVSATPDGKISYAVNDGTPCEPVVCIYGQSVILADQDFPEDWIKVTRTTQAIPAGTAVIRFHDKFNDVFSMSDAAEAESSAGGSRYRCVMVASGIDCTDAKFWIKPMATRATSTVAQLSGAGAGTIQGATDCFVDWDQQGWAHIRNSAGVLREIVYYASRTDSVLTVPALGRGRLGTSATAGDPNDMVDSVGPYRIAWENASPIVKGNVQTLASESTAPTGVTWSASITAAYGVGPSGVFANGTQGGLFIHRELPAGVSGFSRQQCRIAYSFTTNGTTYTGTLGGIVRIADNDLEQYELHVGVGSLPDLSASPNEVFTSIPYTTTLTLGTSTTNYAVVNRRNKYNLATKSLTATVFRIDGSGNQVQPVPTGPDGISWRAGDGGTFLLDAVYVAALDGDYPADEWEIYLRTNGTDPDPSIDTPTTQALTVDGNGIAYLSGYATTAYSDGTTGKVILRVKRTSDSAYSTNTDIHTAIAVATDALTTPVGRAFHETIAEVPT